MQSSVLWLASEWPHQASRKQVWGNSAVSQTELEAENSFCKGKYFKGWNADVSATHWCLHLTFVQRLAWKIHITCLFNIRRQTGWWWSEAIGIKAAEFKNAFQHSWSLGGCDGVSTFICMTPLDIFKEISRQSPAVLVETQADAFNETWNRRPAVHAATKIGI